MEGLGGNFWLRIEQLTIDMGARDYEDGLGGSIQFDFESELSKLMRYVGSAQGGRQGFQVLSVLSDLEFSTACVFTLKLTRDDEVRNLGIHEWLSPCSSVACA